MNEFLLKLLLSAVVALVVKRGVALLGSSIAWWIAAVIGLVLVFGGWFFWVHSDGLAD
ncbi:MAG: hypothetical protein ABW022_07255 [Actinoplanes sp.]